MALKIYLIRHGETDFNKEGREWGQQDSLSLNKRGILQSKKLAEKLRGVHFDKLFSSPLRRAVQTAEEISRPQKIKIFFDERLKEYEPGEVDPSSEKWMNKYNEMLNSGISKYEIRPFGGDNIWDLIKRVGSFLDDLENESGTIVIVAHSGVNSMLINLSQRKEKNDFYKIKQDNTCINILNFHDGKWGIESINESYHIDEFLPKKKTYENQEEIKEKIDEKVRGILEGVIKDIHIGGDLAKREFGSYEEPYKRRKGSTIELYPVIKNNFKIQRKWKVVLFNKDIKKYEIGKIVLNNTEHKINLNLIKDAQKLKFFLQ